MFRASLLGVTLLVLAVLSRGTDAWATERLDAATIKAALRTADVEEEGFVQKVVDMAINGQLPPSLVDTTFQWARKKPKHKFQYFKRALVLRAAEQGITL